MEKTKILYISYQIAPFSEESQLSNLVSQLSQGIHQSDKEIRVFMPRFGCINERRHQLHEVIRLSGMNLIIGDADHPLIIKVASVPAIRLQVYFIDNEEYFKRKFVDRDEKGKFFDDNDERAMFFCKGVLETAKKLGWSPDIIHCHGWMSTLMPLYLKKAYNNDPYFTNSKVISTVYKEKFPKSLNVKLIDKLIADGMTKSDCKLIQEPTYLNLIKLAAQYSDGLSFGSCDLDKEIIDVCKNSGLPLLEYSEDNLIDRYNNFYDEIHESNSVLID